MQLRTILLPTDFSGCANYAVAYAAAIARAARAKVICIYVLEPMVPAVGYTGLADPMPIADISEQLEDSAERELPQVVPHGESVCFNVRVVFRIIDWELTNEVEIFRSVLTL